MGGKKKYIEMFGAFFNYLRQHF